MTEVGTKLSQVPSELSTVPGGGVAGAARVTPSRLSDADGKSGASPGVLNGRGHKYSHQGTTVANRVGQYHHGPSPMSFSNLVVPLPCLRPFGRRASRPDATTVLYAMSTAVREALPLWLLAGAKDGGIETSPQRVGAVFAAGVLIAGAGRVAAAATGCCGTSLSEVGNGEMGRRVSRAVWGRLVSVAVLGLLHLLPRLLLPPSAAAAIIPSEVLWLALTAVVISNQASLDVCSTGAAAAAAAARSQPQQRPMFVSRNTSSSSCCDERTRATSDASSRGGSDLVDGSNRRPQVMSASILLVGDVLGATAGPLVLALALWAGFDSSLWLLLCLFGDLWLAAGARETKPLHVSLLACQEGEDEEEEEEERRRAQRFAQFV